RPRFARPAPPEACPSARFARAGAPTRSLSAARVERADSSAADAGSRAGAQVGSRRDRASTAAPERAYARPMRRAPLWLALVVFACDGPGAGDAGPEPD